LTGGSISICFDKRRIGGKTAFENIAAAAVFSYGGDVLYRQKRAG
jgi:hypothetical protein